MKKRNVNNKIIVYRKALELKQFELAEMIGVTHQALSAWEKGLQLPRVDNAIRLADVLGTTVEDLFSP